jgi:hypothetical protein
MLSDPHVTGCCDANEYSRGSPAYSADGRGSGYDVRTACTNLGGYRRKDTVAKIAKSGRLARRVFYCLASITRRGTLLPGSDMSDQLAGILL